VADMVGAKSKDQLLPACRALDRLVSHEHLLIPQWTASTHRMAYNAWRLARPAPSKQYPQGMPPYAQGLDWAIGTWWAKP
jgi:microcin C transport system substrate-binding protein